MELATATRELSQIAVDSTDQLTRLSSRALSTPDLARVVDVIGELLAHSDAVALAALEHGDAHSTHLAFACSKELEVLDRMLVTSRPEIHIPGHERVRTRGQMT